MLPREDSWGCLQSVAACSVHGQLVGKVLVTDACCFCFFVKKVEDECVYCASDGIKDNDFGISWLVCCSSYVESRWSCLRQNLLPKNKVCYIV